MSTTMAERSAKRVTSQARLDKRRYRVRSEMHSEDRSVPIKIFAALRRIPPLEIRDILQRPLEDLWYDGEVEYVLSTREREVVLVWFKNLNLDNLPIEREMVEDERFVQIFEDIRKAKRERNTAPPSDEDLENLSQSPQDFG